MHIEKNNRHITNVYSEKAMNLLRICMTILGFSSLTYFIIYLFYRTLDFGIIFEVIGFIFIVLAYNKIPSKDWKKSQKYILFAMLPIGCLIFYDFLHLLVNLDEVLPEVLYYFLSTDKYFYYIEPYLYDISLVLTFGLLYSSYISLNKAKGDIEYEDYTEEFYDKI